VGDGVVPDLVPLGDDAAHDLGVALRVGRDDVEGGLDVALLQDVEQSGGVLGMGAVVEGQGDEGKARRDTGVGIFGAHRGREHLGGGCGSSAQRSCLDCFAFVPGRAGGHEKARSDQEQGNEG